MVTWPTTSRDPDGPEGSRSWPRYVWVEYLENSLPLEIRRPIKHHVDRYGCEVMATFVYPRWPSAAILDFWKSKVAPLDRPSPAAKWDIFTEPENLLLSFFSMVLDSPGGLVSESVGHPWAFWEIQDGVQDGRQFMNLTISLQRIIRFTSCLVLGYGFRGRRIEWCYFRFHKIQDGGRPPSWKIRRVISPRQVIRSTSCLVLG